MKVLPFGLAASLGSFIKALSRILGPKVDSLFIPYLDVIKTSWTFYYSPWNHSGSRIKAIDSLSRSKILKYLLSFFRARKLWSVFVLSLLMNPLTKLFRKNITWSCGVKEKSAFRQIKDVTNLHHSTRSFLILFKLITDYIKYWYRCLFVPVVYKDSWKIGDWHSSLYMLCVNGVFFC